MKFYGENDVGTFTAVVLYELSWCVCILPECAHLCPTIRTDFGVCSVCNLRREYLWVSLRSIKIITFVSSSVYIYIYILIENRITRPE